MGIEHTRPVPEPTLRRLPRYHHLVSLWLKEEVEWVSCTQIGLALEIDPTQVRKDIAYTGVAGRRRRGYPIQELLKAIEGFLGWTDVRKAFLAGAGHLGTALVNSPKFEAHGLDIVAAFDVDEEKVARAINGRTIYPLEKMAAMARRMHVLVGIITVPAEHAQYVADQMVAGGIQAIWNFAPTSLETPSWVIVHHEDLFSSLAVLSRRLKSRLSMQEERSAEK